MDKCGSALDFFERNEVAPARAGADFARRAPGFGRFQIRIPERPASALPGPGRVNRATAVLAVIEGAVAARPFGQAEALADLADESACGIIDRFAAKFGDLGDFFGRDPDVARCAGAAVSATGTREVQAILMPGTVVGRLCRSVRLGRLVGHASCRRRVFEGEKQASTWRIVGQRRGHSRACDDWAQDEGRRPAAAGRVMAVEWLSRGRVSRRCVLRKSFRIGRGLSVGHGLHGGVCSR